MKKQPVVLSRETYRQQARVLKALANESRLMIIARLNQGQCSVGELVTLVGSDQSTVSKHLAVLRAHGIVEDRREGTTVYYTLLTPCRGSSRSVGCWCACTSRSVRST